MPLFEASARYSPFTALCVGVLHFLGATGFGLAILRLIGVRLPGPWRLAAGLFLGFLSFALGVEVLGMFGAASKASLICGWGVGAGLGLLGWRGEAIPAVRGDASSRAWSALPLGILLVNLLVAVAPSSKFDEIRYHMLLPSRIVTEGTLHYYRLPFEGAILPQMAYQFSVTPLYALGVPDAANVAAWCISAAFAWFVWCILRERGMPRVWAAIGVSACLAGVYAVVWHVTAGGYALGDFATTVAAAALLCRERVLRTVSSPAYALLISISALAMTSSRVSLAPMAGAVMLFAAVFHWRESKGERLRILSAAVLPWLILAAPIMIWTAAQSGSPWGPVPAGNHQAPAGVVEATRMSNQSAAAVSLPLLLLQYSPILWLGVLAFFVRGAVPFPKRLAGSVLFMMQFVLIALLLPWDFRFMGGLQYGLALAAAVWLVSPTLVEMLGRVRVKTVGIVALLPWMAAQAAYGVQFAPVALGLEEGRDFYERYVAFYRDYQAIDRILPTDAVLLMQGAAGFAYAPRPAYLEPQDLPSGREAYLFAIADPEGLAVSPVPGFTFGAVAYTNPNAVAITFRTPGREPEPGSLAVIRLVPNR